MHMCNSLNSNLNSIDICIMCNRLKSHTNKNRINSKFILEIYFQKYNFKIVELIYLCMKNPFQI